MEKYDADLKKYLQAAEQGGSDAMEHIARTYEDEAFDGYNKEKSVE